MAYPGSYRPQDECAVFGIFGVDDASAHTVLGLHALQHRGQESSGVVSHDGRQFHIQRSLGRVGDNFNTPQVMERLKGFAAIGHNRYSTTGETLLRNVQPLFAELEHGGLAIAHNGNLTNARKLREQLIRRGCIFQSTVDSEVLIHLIATSLYEGLTERLIDAIKQVVGAYSLIALTDKVMIGVRDPVGVRPLVLGELDGAPILASETCAFDIIGANFVRDVEPGEIVICSRDRVESVKPFQPRQQRYCIFEYVYFSRPDSIAEGQSVYSIRKQIGAELARESHVPADLVVAVPDSGVPAAIGYAAETGLPYELGIIRNHYVGRTFIEPSQTIRHLGVKLKHNANRRELEGKRVILVDDSIVRGTTSQKIVEMVRASGALEIHMRIASPPTAHPCFYGIDTPNPEELLAANMDMAQMIEHIGVDTLSFISNDGLYRAVRGEARDPVTPQYCDACFTGDYPISLVDQETGETPPLQLMLLADEG